MAVSFRAEDEYVSDGNEVVEFKLVRDVEDINNAAKVFKPTMSHQIFGPAETVYGYKNLRIKLYFSAANLTPFLGVVYSEKVSPKKSCVEPDNIQDIIRQKLLIPFTTSVDEFSRSLTDEAKFQPMGSLVHTFKVPTENEEKVYVIHKCDTSTKGLIPYHGRLQTFVLWFIDAASFIDIDDDKWQFFLMFEKYKKNGDDMYAIAGFATVYEYYAYPEHLRPRVSQMLVLTPFQCQGLGAELLLCIYNYYKLNSKVRDITVEDPSAELQSVRDFVDCQLFSTHSRVKNAGTLTLDIILDVAKELKINKKQARRVYEILRLKTVNRAIEEEYRSYRLEVKKRLNVPHKNELSKMKKLEVLMKPQEITELRSSLMLNEQHRFDTLDKTYKELEEQYDRVIRRLDKEEARMG